MGLTITAHRKLAGGVSYHSRRRISCAASQREAEHGVSWLEAVRWAPPSPLHLRNFSHACYRPVHDSPNKTSQISAKNKRNQQKLLIRCSRSGRDGFENKLRPASRAGHAYQPRAGIGDDEIGDQGITADQATHAQSPAEELTVSLTRPLHTRQRPMSISMSSSPARLIATLPVPGAGEVTRGDNARRTPRCNEQNPGQPPGFCMSTRPRSAFATRSCAQTRSRFFAWSHFLRKTGSPLFRKMLRCCNGSNQKSRPSKSRRRSRRTFGSGSAPR